MIQSGQSVPRNRLELGAVLIAFNPDRDVEGRLLLISRQVGSVVVVDNTEDRAARESFQGVCRDREWTCISGGRNEGVAAALNRGIRHLAGLGYKWTLLFDQDSRLSSDFCEALLVSCRMHPEPMRLALVGPSFFDPVTSVGHRYLRPHPNCRWWFQKVAVRDDDLPQVSMVITSGSLLNISAYADVGGFEEGLFIDYVDTDFCLRCLRRGWLIGVSAGARMEHRLGDRQEKKWAGLTLHPTNHPPFRHYYIGRNRVMMWKRHMWRFPHWAAFDLAAFGLWIFRILAAEDQKTAKLLAMARGTWAGVRGRSGKWKQN